MKLNTPTLTPDEFVKRWQNAALTERAAYQQHFIDVCHLVGAKTPIELDPTNENYAFEYGLKKTNGRQGYADVFYRGQFAIEYKQKGKYKDLAEAYQQLLQYRENLNNPPLLIVCDIENWEIHTNFTNAPTTVQTFKHDDLTKTNTRGILRRIFSDPNSFHPEKNKLQITEDVAAKFKAVVDDTVKEWQNDPERVARFMTKLVFCMFVEDIGLLPRRAHDGILTEIIRTTRFHRDAREMFARYVRELFKAMATGGNVQMLDIPYFNGSMFQEGDDDIVPLGREALNALDQASDRNWAHVEPSIFGTIFERTLDKAKRGQLGAHYTHPNDIMLIVEPVLMQPLRREWAALQAEAEPISERMAKATNTAQRLTSEAELLGLRAGMLKRVREITVLDPACGSGNFLYISLRLLLDLEKEIITHPLWAGLPEERIKVHPTQLYGIEVNEIAHALASVVVWIGYLQWRNDNGYFERREPILSSMRENIIHADAIMRYDADRKPYEPDWQAVNVIVGNPPFLGDKKMLREFGDKYVSDLRHLYEGRVPGGADLVTYWFERARAQIDAGKTNRAGLLATNSISQGLSRQVLDRIKQTGDIFMTWRDREWVLEGAAVRVAMVGFDAGVELTKTLDGKQVGTINSDFSVAVDITLARLLKENRRIAFIGDTKKGAFDIPAPLANEMREASNPSGCDNSTVILPWIIGLDITERPRNMWIIDFGMDLSESEAARFVQPFEYVRIYVKPARDLVRNNLERVKWWLHARPAPDCRKAIGELTRYIATPTLSKHRLFMWIDARTLPDHQVVAIAREDDYFFGILHSRFHELWGLLRGTSFGSTPRYTPTSTFETFPFPFVPRQEDFSDPRVVATSAAAKALHEERHAWLNPPQWTARSNERTLTNLYNALQAERGTGTRKGIKAAAAEFAPRLNELHQALDEAVCTAYGWDAAIISDEEAILRNLLALNQARSS